MHGPEASERDKTVSLDSDPDCTAHDEGEVLLGASLRVIRAAETAERGVASYATSHTRLAETELVGDASSPTIRAGGAQRQSQTIKVETRLKCYRETDESDLQALEPQPVISCQQHVRNARFTHNPAAKMARQGSAM